MRILPSYEGFATLYDQLMDEAPYKEWAQFLIHTIQQRQANVKKLLDIGCGTGSIAIMMAKQGYSVTGVDLSEEMLSVAHEKIRDLPETRVIRLIHQDMRELELDETFDIIYSFCDSINYLLEDEDVKITFQKIANHLSKDGLFLFDVHSLYKITEFSSEIPIVSEDEELSYIWLPEVDQISHRVDHHLHFFVRIKDNVYRRFYEIHHQRAYSIDQLKLWLAEAKLDIVSITADFTCQAPQQNSERIFFVMRKLD